MDTTAVWNQTLPQAVIDEHADFIDIAEHCEALAATALERAYDEKSREQYHQLHHALTLLQPTLNDPIPAHLIARLTTGHRPASQPGMDTESDLLCEYCLTLSHLLSGESLGQEEEQSLRGLLYELTCFLADTMTAPRWLRTPEGLIPLD